MRRLLTMMCAMLMLASCGAVRTQIQTVYQRDTTYITNTRVDSTFRRDSVFVKEKGDTIYIYKERVRERYRIVRDTLYRSKVDSVYIDREREVKVEKELTAWQRFRLNGFWILAAIVAAIGFWKFRRPLLHLLMKLIP